ncbi:MAG: YceI family protein [Bacteroidota bacterium]|nr:YceI family protein [Bacteroidota bacterium]
MKLYILTILTIVILASCNNNQATQTEEAQTTLTSTEGDSFSLDVTNSVINWEGSSLSGSHNGTLTLKEGFLKSKDGQIVSGSFVLDMASIKDLDLVDVTKNGYLVGHLNDTDFFDTKKFPIGTFEITSIEKIENDSLGNNHKISGNLTLKGISKNISFPANVNISETSISAKGEVVIDRLQWGITYRSSTAFPSLKAKLKDNAINDNIKVALNIVANK